MKSIAVTAHSLAVSPVLRQKLEARFPGVPIAWNTTAQVLPQDSLVTFLQGHSHAVIGRESLNAEVIARLPDLKVVSKYGVGLDSIDIDALAQAGVQLAWTPGVNRRAVAELALTFMLTTLRGVHQASRQIVNGNWTRPKGRQLTGKTVGIIGCGNVGRELAALLRPFGTSLLAYDIRSSESEYQKWFSDHQVKPADLETLLRESDIVSLHVPKNKSTVNIIDANSLSQMRSDAILVNTARGGLVDEFALLRALNEGHLHAAASDVFLEEPSQHHVLITHPAFSSTPHLGGAAEEAVLAMGEAAIQGLSVAGDPLLLKHYL